MKKIYCSLVLFVALFFFVSPVFAASAPPAVLKARESTAQIIVSYEEEDLNTSGSGFAIGYDNTIEFIVTNNHVVEGSPTEIIVSTNDNIKTQATVYKTSPSCDLAILKLQTPIDGLAPLRLYKGDAEKQVGNTVYALGFPGAAEFLFDESPNFKDQVSISSGIVSATKSSSIISTSGRPVQTYQIDVPISAGNSGGPLITGDGSVIGITSFGISPEAKEILAAENINGAVSSLELISFLEESGVPYLTANSIPAWVLFVSIAAICCIVLCCILIIRKKRRKTSMNESNVPSHYLPLETYLQNKAFGIPFNMAVYVLSPVIYQLAQMHEQYQTYIDVVPENIVVDASKNRAYLKPKQFVVQNNQGPVTSYPGYSPMEVLREDIPNSSYTDVYGICALLYRMVFGTPPPDAFSRMQDDTKVQEQINSLPISEDQKQKFLTGLQLNPKDRYQKANGLLFAFNVQYTPDSDYASLTGQSSSSNGGQPSSKENEKPRRKFKLWLIPIFIGAALAVVAGVLLVGNQKTIGEALKLSEQERYSQAVQKFNASLYIPISMEEEYIFARAGYAKQSESFDLALELLNEIPNNEKAAQLKTSVILAYAEKVSEEDPDRALELLEEIDPANKEALALKSDIILNELDWALYSDDYDSAKTWIDRLPDDQTTQKESVDIIASYAFEAASNEAYDTALEILSLLDESDSAEYVGITNLAKSYKLAEAGDYGEARILLGELQNTEYAAMAKELLAHINSYTLLSEMIYGSWENDDYYFVYDDEGYISNLPSVLKSSIANIRNGNIEFLTNDENTIITYEIWHVTYYDLELRNTQTGESFMLDAVF